MAAEAAGIDFDDLVGRLLVAARPHTAAPA
jgi:hypothetical protein